MKQALKGLVALGVCSGLAAAQHQTNSPDAALAINGRAEDGFAGQPALDLFVGDDLRLDLAGPANRPFVVLAGDAREPGFPLADGTLNVDALRVLLTGELDGFGAFCWEGEVPGLAPGTEVTLQALVLHETGLRFTAPESVRILAEPVALAGDLDVVGPTMEVDVSWLAATELVSADDWIAIFRAGTTSTLFLDWSYTGGAAAGQVTLTAPGEPGDYEVRYLRDNGFEQLGESLLFTVLTANVLPEATVVSATELLSVDWLVFDELAQATDVLALYDVTTGTAAFVAESPTGGASDGTALFALPGAGRFEVRYEHADGTSVRASDEIASYDVSLSTAGAPARAGQAFTITWDAAGPLHVLDWIGVFRVGAPNEAYTAWYRPLEQASGSLRIVVDEPGRYELRYLPANGFVDVARSARFRVAPGPSGGGSDPLADPEFQ